jgi:flagellar hook-basal body complex protein FliE
MASPITPIRLPAPVAAEPSATLGSGAGFGAVFRDAVSAVDKMSHNAAQGVERFLAGEGGELHQIALETQRAQLAFELFLQVRNKVVEAYQEVMRSQV